MEMKLVACVMIITATCSAYPAYYHPYYCDYDDHYIPYRSFRPQWIPWTEMGTAFVIPMWRPPTPPPLRRFIITLHRGEEFGNIKPVNKTTNIEPEPPMESVPVASENAPAVQEAPFETITENAPVVREKPFETITENAPAVQEEPFETITENASAVQEKPFETITENAPAVEEQPFETITENAPIVPHADPRENEISDDTDTTPQHLRQAQERKPENVDNTTVPPGNTV